MKKSKILQKTQYIPLLIFSLGALFRLIAFGQIPGGVNADEAMSAVDALALANYGTDRFGTTFPVHLQAWGYGQMSAGLCYLQAVCIKLFGFSTVTIRLPLLLFSLLSMWLMYLIGRKLQGERFGIILLALTASNPWHFLQSRWALDCNLFPHVFLLGFYLLLTGIENIKKRRNLYLSMICFAACFYCYGISVYTVPLFLMGFGIYLLCTKKIKWQELLLCALLFLLVALPEIFVMAINFFGHPTIHTPLFTLQYFDQSIRSNDILLLNFSPTQMWANIKSLCSVAFLQTPGAAYNAPPQFGPMYHISTVFALIGLIDLIYGLAKKRLPAPPLHAAVLVYFAMAITAGILTNNVNVNRINIIFPVLIMLTGIGILRTVKLAKRALSSWSYTGRAAGMAICVGYLLLFIWFLRYYYFIFQSKVGDRDYFYSYINAIQELDQKEYDALFISCFTGYSANNQISEILTEYACRLDAEYTQGLTNVTGDRILLPYIERYRFFYSWDISEIDLLLQTKVSETDLRIVFMVHQDELDLIDLNYNIVGQSGEFCYLIPSS